MFVSTLVKSPFRIINLLRSPLVRAESPYTTNWGLRRLSNKADTSEMRKAICLNLWDRMNAGTVDISSLYYFNKDLLARVLKVRPDELKLGRLVATAKPGKFEMPFKGRGVVMVEVIDRITGTSSFEKQYYEQEAVRSAQGYNLPFFIWMKGVIGAEKWEFARKGVLKNDKLLGLSLENLEGKLELVQEQLRKKYPLPSTKSMRVS